MLSTVVRLAKKEGKRKGKAKATATEPPLTALQPDVNIQVLVNAALLRLLLDTTNMFGEAQDASLRVGRTE